MCVLPRLRPRRPNFALPACSASASLTLPRPTATRRRSLWSTARRPRTSHGRATPTRRSRRRSRRVSSLFALHTAPWRPVAACSLQGPEVRVEHRLLTRALAAFSLAGGVPHGEHWQGCVSIAFSCASAHLLTDLRVQPSTPERVYARVSRRTRFEFGTSRACREVLVVFFECLQSCTWSLLRFPAVCTRKLGCPGEVESTFAGRPAPAFRSPPLLVSPSLSSSARPCFRALASTLHLLPRVGCTAVVAVPLRLSPFLA